MDRKQVLLTFSNNPRFLFSIIKRSEHVQEAFAATNRSRVMAVQGKKLRQSKNYQIGLDVEFLPSPFTKINAEIIDEQSRKKREVEKEKINSKVRLHNGGNGEMM